jgi:hypothetical protein
MRSLICTFLLITLTHLPHDLRAQNMRPGAPRPSGTSRRVLIRQVMENMIRAIEIYSDTGSLRGAILHIDKVEREMNAAARWARESPVLIEHLQNARYSLVRAATMHRAKTRPDKIKWPDSALITEMADDYECEEYDACIKEMIAEAQAHQKQALLGWLL